MQTPLVLSLVIIIISSSSSSSSRCSSKVVVVVVVSLFLLPGYMTTSVKFTMSVSLSPSCTEAVCHLSRYQAAYLSLVKTLVTCQIHACHFGQSEIRPPACPDLN